MTSRKITRTAITVTVAVLLGYIESLFPPMVPIPGIKLGIANIVILFLIYTDSFKTACTVSLLKVLLCSVLFGSVTSFIYSLGGAVISLLSMAVVKKMKFFSVVGVSCVGGIMHNLSQLLCAYFFLGKGVLVNLPVLFISGTVCGIVTGVAAQLIIKRGRRLFGER